MGRIAATGPSGLEDFAGRWTISRRIEDARMGEVLQGTGGVTCHPAPGGGLIYDEELWLSPPGRPALRGTRRYLWREIPGGIAVFFEDGRPFHRIALGGSEAGDRHDCAPDLYRVHYDFRDWPGWSARWQVSGPRKDYVSLTEFHRA